VAKGTRKTAQEVADENLETAVRVHQKAVSRVAKAKAAYEKAEADAAMAGRKVKAARMVAGADDDAPEDSQPEPDPEVAPAAPSADEDLV
jgi:hypothetical protein